MNAEESYQAAVAEIREAIGAAELSTRVKRGIGRPRKADLAKLTPPTLKPPIPERPTHCTCRNPCFGYPMWGVRYDRKCGRAER